MKKSTFVTLEQIKEIEKNHPTPYHLYDEKGIKDNIKRLKDAFSWNKGFKEYCQLDLLTHIPQLIGIQSTGANPVVTSFKNQSPIQKLEKINTIASAIAVADPVDGLKAIEAIHKTGGEADEVTDKQIQEAFE